MAAGLVLLDGPEGSLSGLSPWLAVGRLLPLSSHCLPAVCVSVSKSPLSMRILDHNWFEVHPNDLS